MIKNILFSICFHFIIILLIILSFNTKRNNRIKRYNNEDFIAINNNFDLNKIKFNFDKNFNFLNLSEKIVLYNYITNDKNYLNNKNRLLENDAINFLKKEKIQKGKKFNMAECFKKNNRIKNINVDNIFTYQNLNSLKDALYIKNVNNELTEEEIINIKKQMTICFKNSLIKNNKKLKMPLSVKLKFNKRGVLDTNLIKVKILDKDNSFNNNDYEDALDILKYTLIYCNKLNNLPYIKYGKWSEMDFIFNNKF